MTRAGTSRRATSILLLAALAGGILPAMAQGASGGGITATGRTVAPQGDGHGAAGSPPSYAAQLVACRRSARAEGRLAVVGTTMRPVAGSTRLDVKIDLYQRSLPAGSWTARDDVPGLGSWTGPSDPAIGSRPGDVFKYRQAVGRLDFPYAYRFRVGFRWLDDSGAVVREATTRTRACRQPDLRPELAIAGVVTHASKRLPGLVRYRVTLRNDGRSVARGVVVAATLPGDTAAGTHTAQAGPVGPGETTDVMFTGPGCAADGAPVPSFTVDPANAIDETDETDNTLALVCPVP